MRILREPKHQLCSCGHLFSWKIQALYTTTVQQHTGQPHLMTSKILRREILWGKEGRDKTYSGVCKLILFTILKSDTICIYEVQQRTRVKRAMQKTSDRICHPFWAFWILHSPPPTTKYGYSTNAWMSLFLIERWRANQFESQVSGSHG